MPLKWTGQQVFSNYDIIFILVAEELNVNKSTIYLVWNGMIKRILMWLAPANRRVLFARNVKLSSELPNNYVSPIYKIKHKRRYLCKKIAWWNIQVELTHNDFGV